MRHGFRDEPFAISTPNLLETKSELAFLAALSGFIGICGLIIVISVQSGDGGRWGDDLLPATIFLGVIALCLLAPCLYLGWRKGVVLHRREGLVRLWTGPLFPVHSRRHSLVPYRAVQILPENGGFYYQIWLRGPLESRTDRGAPSKWNVGRDGALSAGMETPSPTSSDHRLYLLKGSRYTRIRKMAEEIASYLGYPLEEVGLENRVKWMRRSDEVNMLLLERALRSKRQEMPPERPANTSGLHRHPGRAVFEFPVRGIKRLELWRGVLLTLFAVCFFSMIAVGVVTGIVLETFPGWDSGLIGAVIMFSGFVLYGVFWLCREVHRGKARWRAIATPASLELSAESPLRSKRWSIPVEDLKDLEVRTNDEMWIVRGSFGLPGPGAGFHRLVLRTNDEVFELGMGLSLSKLERVREDILSAIAA